MRRRDGRNGWDRHLLFCGDWDVGGGKESWWVGLVYCWGDSGEVRYCKVMRIVGGWFSMKWKE